VDPGVDSGQAACNGSPLIPSGVCDSSNSDLVLCFTFDDVSGSTINDGSGTNTDGTLMNGATVAAGHDGDSLTQNNNAHQVWIGDPSSVDIPQFTIEAWIKSDGPGSGRDGIADYNNQWGFFLQTDGDLTCRSARTDTANHNVTDGAWHHVACVVDGTDTIIYVDGAEAARVAQGAAGTSSTDGLALAGNSPSGDGFLGQMDNVRMWNRGLTADELCWNAQP
jgi:hypothetical protein